MAIKIGKIIIADIREVWSMGFKLIDVRCQEHLGGCNTVAEVLVDKEEDGPWECTECGATACLWIPSVVAIRDEKSASFIDGQKRDSSYYRLKEAAYLEIEKADAPPEKREEIQKEINKLKKI